LKLRLHAMTL